MSEIVLTPDADRRWLVRGLPTRCLVCGGPAWLADLDCVQCFDCARSLAWFHAPELAWHLAHARRRQYARDRRRFVRRSEAGVPLCKRGHQIAGENAITWRQGERERVRCRECWVMARKPTCPRGHLYSPENTVYWNDGKWRRCKTCLERSA